MRRFILMLVAALLATLALASTSLSSSALVPKGYIDVSLKYGLKQFVLDQPSAKLLVVTNHSNIPLINGRAVINGAQYFAEKPEGCMPFSTIGLGKGCEFRIPRLNPGKSIPFKVRFLLTTQQFPDGVFPGTNVSAISVVILAFDKRQSTDALHVTLPFTKAEG